MGRETGGQVGLVGERELEGQDRLAGDKEQEDRRNGREQRDRTGWQGIGGTGRNGRGQGTGGQDGI